MNRSSILFVPSWHVLSLNPSNDKSMCSCPYMIVPARALVASCVLYYQHSLPSTPHWLISWYGLRLTVDMRLYVQQSIYSIQVSLLGSYGALGVKQDQKALELVLQAKF